MTSYNEFDHADFQGVYQGKSLLEGVEFKAVPWEIGEPQPVVCNILDIEQPGALLDVGCGMGRNANAAYERGYTVTAIDNAKEAIEKCKKLFGNTSIIFDVADACNLVLNKKFDIIIDAAVYHTIPTAKRQDYMLEMHRVANTDTLFHLITFLPSRFGMPKPLAVDLSEIARNAELADWQIISVEQVEYKGNAEAVADFCTKRNVSLKLDEKGRTRLPSWHILLKIKQQ